MLRTKDMSQQLRLPKVGRDVTISLPHKALHRLVPLVKTVQSVTYASRNTWLQILRSSYESYNLYAHTRTRLYVRTSLQACTVLSSTVHAYARTGLASYVRACLARCVSRLGGGVSHPLASGSSVCARSPSHPTGHRRWTSSVLAC